jgi:hypothetical protein
MASCFVVGRWIDDASFEYRASIGFYGYARAFRAAAYMKRPGRLGRMTSSIPASRLVAEARKLIGVPFQHQGRNSFGVDCAGVTLLAFRNAGVDFARLVGIPDKANYGRGLNPRALEILEQLGTRIDAPVPGCLVVFQYAREPLPRHQVLHDPKGAGFPEHRHPHVDSIEYVLAGEIDFTVRGRHIPRALVFEAAADGAAGLCGKIRRIRPTDWHGGEVSPKGGVFISLQEWLDGVEPSSVVLDWIGPAHRSVTHAGASMLST